MIKVKGIINCCFTLFTQISFANETDKQTQSFFSRKFDLLVTVHISFLLENFQ